MFESEKPAPLLNRHSLNAIGVVLDREESPELRRAVTKRFRHLEPFVHEEQQSKLERGLIDKDPTTQHFVIDVIRNIGSVH